MSTWLPSAPLLFCLSLLMLRRTTTWKKVSPWQLFSSDVGVSMETARSSYHRLLQWTHSFTFSDEKSTVPSVLHLNTSTRFFRFPGMMQNLKRRILLYICLNSMWNCANFQVLSKLSAPRNTTARRHCNYAHIDGLPPSN